MYFTDRKDAGKRLAEALLNYERSYDTMVLGLPKGGVEVAFEVSRRLELPMDILMVRKLALPDRPNIYFGAVSWGETCSYNQDAINKFQVTEKMAKQAVRREGEMLAKMNEFYRDGEPAPDLTGKTVILVDDGIATGSNMKAAVEALKIEHPAKIIVAAPVCSRVAHDEIAADVSEIVTLQIPEPYFYGIGSSYLMYDPLEDKKVKDIFLNSLKPATVN